MKKFLFTVLFVCLFNVNVKADVVLPKVIVYKAMITNKDGAVCYDENKNKSDVLIPYKRTFNVEFDSYKGLIYVSDSEYSCYVKTDDLGAMDSEFDLKNKNITKINSVKAVVLASNGLNLRKGPATSYRKIATVPSKTILTIKYQAGTYWYYVEYDNKTGWVTAMNQYVGYEDNKVLVNNKAVNIYDSKERILGKIPANSEVNNYLKLVKFDENDPIYYVVYNGISGYIHDEMYEKTNGDGIIRLVNEVDIKDANGNPTKRLTKNQELTYTMMNGENNFYLNEKDSFVKLDKNDFQYVQEAKIKIKETGYVGEGSFGEEKEVVIREPQEEPHEDEKKEDSSLNMKEIFIVGLLLGILIVLIILVIIKLVNRKEEKRIEDSF